MDILFRQRKIKNGPFSRFALGPYFTSMFVNDALHNGQAHACAFKLSFGVQPLKNAEKFVSIGHIEAHTVIAE
ncbi:hypothetical protein SAMN05421755_10514 [Nitrosomonas sp. Nm33]|nr:hypothetical protein SAMN05421755_10514 [Nitrosomonas sp. Nm33]